MNNLSTCFYCNVPLNTSSPNPEYYRCPTCGTFYRVSQQEYSSYVDGDFRAKYERVVSKMLNDDKRHYEKMGNRADCKRAFNGNEYGTIYSFGGGLPKLESYFKCDRISVFDLNADVYEVHMDEFQRLYPIGNTPVELQSVMIDPAFIESIPFAQNDLVTFVHFLEHLWAHDVRGILDAIPPGVHVMIYQPNAGKATHSNWFHFNNQHVTLIGGQTLANFVKSWYNANILSYVEIDNDFFLMFEKPMI